MLLGAILGTIGYLVVRFGLGGLYTLNQNERGVKMVFGRAERLGPGTSAAMAGLLKEEERARYDYPAVRVIMPGGPYFKMPWERIQKISIATRTVNMAWDPDDNGANYGGTVLDAVTRDQLNTGLVGQMRFRVSERNLYAYLFGVKNPISHVMGYLVSVLRERIANFEARPPEGEAAEGQTDFMGVSINDLRKNLRALNDHMARESTSAEARYGIVLDASLITGIEPPQEVESALAAINTAHNEVSSDISLAQAKADQTIVQSRRAVEIETLRASAEAQPLIQIATELQALRASGASLALYLRNIRLALYRASSRVIVETPKEWTP